MVMICKQCGEQMQPEDEVCPSCGAPAHPQEGGVGFWDLLERPEKPDAADAPASTPVPDEATSRPARDKAPLAQLPIVCLVLSIVCLVGVIATNMTLSGSVRKLEDQVAALKEEQRQQSEDASTTVAALQARLDELERASLASEDEESTDEAEGPYGVYDPYGTTNTTNTTDDTDAQDDTPSTASSRVGTESDADKPGLTLQEGRRNSELTAGYKSVGRSYLFACEVAGDADELVWEKRADDGSWEAISFRSPDNRNAQYGIKLEEDADGTSRLVADGLTDASVGEYRCVVRDDLGNVVVQTRSAELSLANAGY